MTRGTRTRTVLALAGSLAVAASCGLLERPDGDRDPRHDESGRSGRVDLNSATWRTLAGLPGISGLDADHIIASRPYRRSRALVEKRVLSEQKFEAIRDLVYVEQESRD